MKKRDAFVLAGFKRNNLADYGEPASLEEPEIVITIGMQNLPELWGTCQSWEEPARFSCEGNRRLQQERRICQMMGNLPV